MNKMNKKVLGTVLGSCLFLCGDYGCAAPRDVVVPMTAAGKRALKRYVRDSNVENITIDCETKKREDWVGFVEYLDSSDCGFSECYEGYSKKAGDKMGDVDVLFVKNKANERSDERRKRIREDNAKYTKTPTIKPSSPAPGGTSPGGDKKDVELENSRSKFVNVSLNKYSGSSCVTELRMKDISRLCKDKSRLDEIVAKVESGYYDVLDESCFVDLVKHELRETTSVLEKILDRSGGKVEFKSKFDKDVAQYILSAFGNDAETCEGLGIVEFVDAVEKNSIKLDGVSSEGGIRDAIKKYNKDELEKAEKEKLEKMYEAVELAISSGVAEKMCKGGDEKINEGKCSEISKLQLAKNGYGNLYNGVSDLDDQVKIVEALLDINKRGLLDVALKNGVYVTCITGKSILLYANSDDVQKSMLNKENFVGIMSSAGDNFAEMVANYNKSKTESKVVADLEAAYINDCGDLKVLGLSKSDLSGLYKDVLYNISKDNEFCDECVNRYEEWCADSGDKIVSLSELLEGGDANKICGFWSLLGSVYKAVCSFKKDSPDDQRELFSKIVDLVNGEKVNGVKLDTSDDPAYQIAQTFKALGLCTTKEITKMAIDTVKQYVVDPSVGSKINLDWVSGNIQDNGNVKIGDKEYDGGSFVVIFAHKTFSVAEFNAKSALDDKQTYLNDVAQGAGIKPVGPEAK